MKTNLKCIFGALALSLTGCANHSTPTLQGEFSGIEADSLSVLHISNEWYHQMSKIDKIPVQDGRFTYPLDSIKSGLYALMVGEGRGSKYVKVFLEPTDTKVRIEKDKNNLLKASSTGGMLTNKYSLLQADLYQVGNMQALDSLDNLFYAARAKNDTEEMSRIKESSMPYYEGSSVNKKKFIAKLQEEEGHSSFGMYLYYSYKFQNRSFNTLEEIQQITDYLEAFPAEAKALDYYSLMKKSLDRFKKCAVGALAPSIEGVDKDGKAVSLKDFQGKYVLVDFWSSGCTWCRLETPHLLSVYHTFKDKNFTVLGVSSDRSKEKWLQAIEEDKSYWNQMILPREKTNEIYDAYCIVGIPHIILVGPNGKILAKNLRGEDIATTVTKFVK